MPSPPITYQTGETCPATGNYVSDCVHNVGEQFREGDIFPPCPEDSANINWSPKLQAPFS